MAISVSLGGPLAGARFLERPNRFLVRAELEQGESVEAHLADPGRLKEVLIPGRRLLLRSASGRHRRTRWQVVLAERPSGRGWISLDSTLPSRLVGRALESGGLPELADWSLVRAEFPVGSHRFDFLLEGPDGGRLLVEVKSVGLVEDGVGLFPDAPTDRGRRHVEHLAQLVETGTYAAAVLFVAQRGDAREVRPAAGIDPAFAEALARAEAVGVRLLGRRCLVGPERSPSAPGSRRRRGRAFVRITGSPRSGLRNRRPIR